MDAMPITVTTKQNSREVIELKAWEIGEGTSILNKHF